ncbi:MAG: PQQ-dependent sugar dehydrogenase [Bacteroidetes bacterium]|nr:PQQ-dependent sugar dehydrogenase [Bacteroidota bacterium]
MKYSKYLLVLILITLVHSCKKEESTAISLEIPAIEIEKVVDKYEIIWGMDFLPNGDLIFGEKRGKMYLKTDQNNTITELSGLPSIDAGGQGGLLDIKTHPNYVKNGWIYMSYTSSTPYYALKLSRFKINNNKIENLQNIFTATGPGGHNGSRIVFDKSGLIYLSIGEGPSTGGGPTGINKNASDPSSPWGKIHRLNDDGSIPNTNPILPGNASRNSMYTLGHRNPQGLALHPSTGEIWESEHGPLGGDEINIIKAGQDYGWPALSLGKNYDGSIISKNHDSSGISKPIYSWIPSIGTCGIAFINGNYYRSWSGSLIVAGLASQKLHRCIVENNTIKSEEIILKDLGRVRNVIQGIDGALYVSVEVPGRILKMKVK